MKRKILFLALASPLFAAGAAFAPQQDGMPPPPKPSPEHAQVMKLVGTWEVTMKQGDKPEPQKASITFEKVGDYWVTGHFRGTYMGMPFEGQSTQGYSPTKKKMVGTWVDSRMPEVGIGEGTWDPGAKTIRMTWQCPMKPDQKGMETVVFKDDDHFTSTMTMKDADGKDMPPMTMEYVRKGSSPARG